MSRRSRLIIVISMGNRLLRIARVILGLRDADTVRAENASRDLHRAIEKQGDAVQRLARGIDVPAAPDPGGSGSFEELTAIISGLPNHRPD